MTVAELIEELKTVSQDKEVVDYGFDPITTVYPTTWHDTNHPYDKPDRDVIMIY